MLQPVVSAALLNRIAIDAETHFGAGPVDLEPIQTEERPGTIVVKVAVRRSGHRTPLSHLYVKTYRPRPDRDVRDRVVSEFEATQRIYRLLQSQDGLHAVPPVSCYPDALTLVTEEVQGPTLQDHLIAKGAWFPSGQSLDDLCGSMRAVGRWVRALQTCGGEGPRRTLNSISEYVDHRLKQLVAHPGSHFHQDDRARVLRHIERLVERMTESEFATVPVHGDMALSNVLVAGDRIAVLDFAMMKYEGALLDLTRVYLQTDLLALKPYMRRTVVSRMQAALLTGFDPDVHPGLPAFRLQLLIHRINNLTSVTLKPGAFPESIYNRVVARHHRRSLRAELRTPVAA